MHELSIAMSILDIVGEQAEQCHLGRIEGIHIQLGPLSGVVKEALLSAYELAREGTSLEGARLVVHDVPIVVFCENCGMECSVESPQMLCCTICGTPARQVVHGRELDVSALEVAT